MWLYPWDADDEGVPTVLDAIGSRAGVDGVAMAVAYHSGMFLLPHNPRRKLLFPTPGVYFTPEAARYTGLAIQPIVNDLAASGVVEMDTEGIAVTGDTTMTRTEYERGTFSHWYDEAQRKQLAASRERLMAWRPTLVMPGHDRAFRPEEG